MSIKIQIIVLMILIIALLMLCRQVKLRTIDLKYTLSWFFLVFVLIIIDIFPCIITTLAEAIGIVTPSNMLFLFGLLLTLVIIYTLTAAVSKLSDEVRSMAQKIALLDKELEEYKKTGNKII